MLPARAMVSLGVRGHVWVNDAAAAVVGNVHAILYSRLSFSSAWGSLSQKKKERKKEGEKERQKGEGGKEGGEEEMIPFIFHLISSVCRFSFSCQAESNGHDLVFKM